MPTEQWKPIPGFPAYEVSDHGRVRSTKTWRGDSAPRILRGCRRLRDGYREVALSAYGSSVKRLVHGLVAEAFLGERPEGQQVRHLDGNPSNNHLSNLCYGTQAENNLDIVRHGRNRNANKTHCMSGHPFDRENTGVHRNGRRYCRTCKKAANDRRTAMERVQRLAQRAEVAA